MFDLGEKSSLTLENLEEVSFHIEDTGYVCSCSFHLLEIYSECLQLRAKELVLEIVLVEFTYIATAF